jgi:hypothetical protein
MKLALVGLLSGKDKWGRLTFVKEDTEKGKKSMKKLWKLQETYEGRSSISSKGFTVNLNKYGKNKIQLSDITEFIGCHCSIKVTVKPYEFTNKEGEEMKGFTLLLVDLDDLKKIS